MAEVPLPIPTQAPVPSTDIRNAVFAGAKLDEEVTGSGEFYIDRLGVKRLTNTGRNNQFNAAQEERAEQFQQFLLSSGYVFLGDYEDGPFQFSARNQYIRYNDQYYRLNATTDVGFTTTGTDAISFANDVAHFVLMDGDTLRQNLGSGEPGMGSDLLAFRNLLGRSSTVGDYLRDAYIRVHSRYELLQAIEHINNEIQRPTEIRLARNFASWNDARTDIDIAYARIVGEGGTVFIDATGIPDVDGNYFMRIFDSQASGTAIGKKRAIKLNGFIATGTGRSGNVDYIRFHSPEGSLGEFDVSGIACEEFRNGPLIMQNAYNIKFWGCSFNRCGGRHFYMPDGYSNYGENIELHGCTVSTSGNGTGIENANPNGAIRMFGGSVDYTGKILLATKGVIESSGTHYEFNNSSNTLKSIPFESGTHETSNIKIKGGEIRGNRALPSNITTLFRCGAGGNGTSVDGTLIQGITLPSGSYTINDGDGPFYTNGITVIDGVGNTTIPMLKSNAQNLLSDGNFDFSGIVDWYITKDTSAVVSRVDGVNVKLTSSTDFYRSGAQSMKITKAGGNGSAAVFRCQVPLTEGCMNMYELYAKFLSATGTVYITTHYSTTQYQNQYGIPVPARTKQFGATRIINPATVTEWTRVVQQTSRSYAPAWATHAVIEVSLTSMSAGAMYIDDAKATNL
ncbi:hypothetical protein [Raoultella ornithinolytica]|uniref:hypothetical protein n=1 Tax=Raoultella ornithinolytica TaxID=54291 RepID=UPI001F1D72B3|nr:hypothetical protein [Raoultella ornithinolytica]MCF1304962.1 hypothetical protein [Raoultella ornithinolytica]